MLKLYVLVICPLMKGMFSWRELNDKTFQNLLLQNGDGGKDKTSMFDT